MRAIKILMALAAIVGWWMTASGQAVPDSIAVCPPGEPSEMTVIAPDDIIVQEPAEQPAEDSGSRLMAIEEIAVAADSIMAGYDADWTDLSMQGKLTFDGLPMAVSVKMYMKRGEAVILSARAPFFGEVARVEVDQDSITFINKHTKTYNVQKLDGIRADHRTYLTDLQDILLGQIAFPGHGRLTKENAYMSQWLQLPTAESLIYPASELQTPGTEYGFVVDSEMWQLRSFVLMLQSSGVVVETKYLYGDKGWTLGLEINLPKKKLEGEVQLTYPDYNAVPLEFTEIGTKYRKVDFKQLMKF